MDREQQCLSDRRWKRFINTKFFGYGNKIKEYKKVRNTAVEREKKSVHTECSGDALVTVLEGTV